MLVYRKYEEKKKTHKWPIIIIPTVVGAGSGATGDTGSVVDILAVVGVGVAVGFVVVTVVVDVVLK